MVIYCKDLLHKSFQTNRFRNGDNSKTKDDENIDDIIDSSDDEETEDVHVTAPASPGMEHLLKEQSDANKRLPKNVKYNEHLMLPSFVQSI